MMETLSATDMRRRFSQILQQVAEQDDPVIITRYGQPAAVLMSIGQYEQLRGDSEPMPDWQKQVLEVRRLVAADLGGRTLPPVADLIREMREERSEHLDRVIRGKS